MEQQKLYKFEIGAFKAVVIYNEFIDAWDVLFYCYQVPDYSVKGSYGTGAKCYLTKKKAIAAAKRYIKKNCANN